MCYSARRLKRLLEKRVCSAPHVLRRKYNSLVTRRHLNASLISLINSSTLRHSVVKYNIHHRIYETAECFHLLNHFGVGNMCVTHFLRWCNHVFACTVLGELDCLNVRPFLSTLNWQHRFHRILSFLRSNSGVLGPLAMIFVCQSIYLLSVLITHITIFLLTDMLSNWHTSILHVIKKCAIFVCSENRVLVHQNSSCFKVISIEYSTPTQIFVQSSKHYLNAIFFTIFSSLSDFCFLSSEAVAKSCPSMVFFFILVKRKTRQKDCPVNTVVVVSLLC